MPHSGIEHRIGDVDPYVQDEDEASGDENGSLENLRKMKAIVDRRLVDYVGFVRRFIPCFCRTVYMAPTWLLHGIYMVLHGVM